MFFLLSCAPMPGNLLFKGLDHPTPLENIEITETISFTETYIFCNKMMAEHRPGLFVFNVFMNLGFYPGCVILQWDKDGNINKCDTYISFDLEWLREHELRHCMGYDDVLY